MIDVHSHLTFKQFEEDREKVIEEAKQTLKAIIISGTEPEDSKRALRLAEKHPNFIHVTLGLHPIHIPDLTNQQLEEYLEFIMENKHRIVGIGEIGLDYYWIKETEKIQRTREVFLRLLDLAKEANLPIVLHFREALEEGFKTVANRGIKKAVFHCFSGKRPLAQEIVSEGYCISIAPNIFKSKDVKKAIKVIPLEKMLTETDSPYLGVGGKRGIPQNVRLVIDRIAELKRTNPEKVKEVTTKNAIEFFKLSI